MRVIATAVGYDNVQLRQPGEEFDMPDGAKGSWFTAVVRRGKDPVAPQKGKIKATPAQQSEIDAEKAKAHIGVGIGDDMT